MLSPDNIPADILKAIFEHDIKNKKLSMFGAMWEIVSVNPKRRTVSLQIIGIVEPSDTKKEPKQ